MNRKVVLVWILLTAIALAAPTAKMIAAARGHWLRRHARMVPNDRDFRPGDLVFWSLLNDGVADHCGVLTEERGPTGKLRVIHQFPPECREEDCLGRWTVVGHYRLL